MNDKQIIAISRIKLPLVIEALTRANLEAQGSKPDLDMIMAHLDDEALDGFYDVNELLSARRTTNRILAQAAEGKEKADE